ncbi:hypothetical protein M513_02251 [Trichuris suis]|uniref:Uncharacterized protein n=1 Tax=Trichuris suis TaxID=68888 RepID=A0A085MIE8_9BILA|nr:hypothetical protein M513_02251 [Trichuris suis]
MVFLSQRETMKTCTERWSAIFSLLPRFLAAAFVSYLYDCYWLNPDQLLGYLWVLNKRGVSPNDIWNAFNNYTVPAAVLVNVFSAITIWKVGRYFNEIRPSCAHDILCKAFWLSVLYYVLDLTILIAQNIHWQPHLHDHISVFFKLFSIMTILYVKPGEFFTRLNRSDIAAQ